MRSPLALADMAGRVVAAAPEDPKAWRMHAQTHQDNDDWSAASNSFMQAARLLGDDKLAAGKGRLVLF